MKPLGQVALPGCMNEYWRLAGAWHTTQAVSAFCSAFQAAERAAVLVRYSVRKMEEEKEPDWRPAVTWRYCGVLLIQSWLITPPEVPQYDEAAKPWYTRLDDAGHDVRPQLSTRGVSVQ